MRRALLAAAALLGLAGPALGQNGMPAKDLFGAAATPAPLAARSIGFYSKGCVAGAVALPVDGPGATSGPLWQAMRLSRNRNWGHPALVAFIERFAAAARRSSGWSGILVGDMSQPRGGPMRTGHASHQIGLDVDIWLTPSPGSLSPASRETLGAAMMVRPDRRDVDPAAFTPAHVAVIRAAAEDPEVERIFVNAAIKRALCRSSAGRPWLAKVRPYWGHDSHMHVRLQCQADSPDCRPQEPPPAGDGCGSDLAWWFTDKVLHPPPPKTPPKPRPPLTLADLPPACTGVLEAR
ncbi:penicillin-insensitive murein endopeptidase [Aquabacter spiritensis]|uniref:Murein endopeptidase n=1 Tax=Aquabacter spiritensis TaxID=933073 RepID=A0A4R3LWW5_9HYPH|nr:penicillin-insensitive murein endopeptidase [Aquabacter spiritensis]TCT05092.1 murein endopeptidase [Aquabacter spiritensis]